MCYSNIGNSQLPESGSYMSRLSIHPLFQYASTLNKQLNHRHKFTALRKILAQYEQALREERSSLLKKLEKEKVPKIINLIFSKKRDMISPHQYLCPKTEVNLTHLKEIEISTTDQYVDSNKEQNDSLKYSEQHAYSIHLSHCEENVGKIERKSDTFIVDCNTFNALSSRKMENSKAHDAIQYKLAVIEEKIGDMESAYQLLKEKSNYLSIVKLYNQLHGASKFNEAEKTLWGGLKRLFQTTPQRKEYEFFLILHAEYEKIKPVFLKIETLKLKVHEIKQKAENQPPEDANKSVVSTEKSNSASYSSNRFSYFVRNKQKIDKVRKKKKEEPKHSIVLRHSSRSDEENDNYFCLLAEQEKFGEYPTKRPNLNGSLMT